MSLPDFLHVRLGELVSKRSEVKWLNITRVISSPQCPFSVSHCELKAKCPAFKGGNCPYSALPSEMKGIAAKCPAFKNGCPWKSCHTVGEYLEIMAKMRDTCKGKTAYLQFFNKVVAVSKAGESKMGVCPFNKHLCQFTHDAQGKPIVPK